MRRPRLARPPTTSWADEVEENSRGRLLTPLDTHAPAVAREPINHASSAAPRKPINHAAPAGPREPISHAAPYMAGEPVVGPLSAPSIPCGDHRMREVVRDIGDLRLEDYSNNNLQRRWTEAKRRGNISPYFESLLC